MMMILTFQKHGQAKIHSFKSSYRISRNALFPHEKGDEKKKAYHKAN